ncbi:hypothetical protein FA95DRAFT_1553091 [Auriscalpium vulgare]|uniref:Uncharacterized protein n=1 Tax=Auriscalpium vulgare TaxID=40419 RepID=A0ACB8S8J2_9AGAM|nr:hypothetical protein FA95DRAFT_1553091 [Auriscalpium vulgare]
MENAAHARQEARLGRVHGLVHSQIQRVARHENHVEDCVRVSLTLRTAVGHYGDDGLRKGRKRQQKNWREGKTPNAIANKQETRPRRDHPGEVHREIATDGEHEHDTNTTMP